MPAESVLLWLAESLRAQKRDDEAAEAEQQLAAEFRITSIPTLMVFRDGIMVYSQPGALPAPQLEQLIQGARDLDMDDVRRQIAERESQPAA